MALVHTAVACRVRLHTKPRPRRVLSACHDPLKLQPHSHHLKAPAAQQASPTGQRGLGPGQACFPGGAVVHTVVR